MGESKEGRCFTCPGSHPVYDSEDNVYRCSECNKVWGIVSDKENEEENAEPKNFREAFGGEFKKITGKEFPFVEEPHGKTPHR